MTTLHQLTQTLDQRKLFLSPILSFSGGIYYPESGKLNLQYLRLLVCGMKSPLMKMGLQKVIVPQFKFLSIKDFL
jgi:hypothetical protein